MSLPVAQLFVIAIEIIFWKGVGNQLVLRTFCDCEESLLLDNCHFFDPEKKQQTPKTRHTNDF